jgi:hypothetical protein
MGMPTTYERQHCKHSEPSRLALSLQAGCAVSKNHTIHMSFNRAGLLDRHSMFVRSFATAVFLGFSAWAAPGQTPAADAPAQTPPPALDASAEEKPEQPWEKGSIRVGGFIANFNSTLSFGLNTSGGANLDAEDLLGLDNSLVVIRADALYRPGKSRRNQIDIGYAGYHRTGDATLTREITINGNTYPVGAHVDTVFNFDLIRADYTYAFIQNERVRLALGVGLYAVPVKYSLDIQTESGRSAVEGADTAFPLPSLALRTEVQVLPCLFLNANIDGIYLEISDFKGMLVDLTAGVEYRPWKHVGMGVAYGFTAARVEGESGSSSYPGANFVGSVDIRFSGVLLYGKLSF